MSPSSSARRPQLRTGARLRRRVGVAAALVAVLAGLGAGPVGAETPQLPAPFWARERAVPLQGSYEPVVGDFDGDGFDDLYWYAVGSARDHLWLGGGAAVHLAFTDVADVQQVVGRYAPLVGDFGGDEADDIYWNESEGDRDTIWVGGLGRTRPTAIRGVRSRSAIGIVVHATAGRDAVAWVVPGVGVQIETFTSGATQVVQVPFTPGTQPVVGDLDGNGWDDIYWYGPGATPDRITWRNGPSDVVHQAVTDVVGTYDVVAGDLDADGIDDLFFQRDDGRSNAPDRTVAPVWFGRAGRTFATAHWPSGRGVPFVSRSHVGRPDQLVLGMSDAPAEVVEAGSVRATGNTPLLNQVLLGRFTAGTHDDALDFVWDRRLRPSQLFLAPPAPA